VGSLILHGGAHEFNTLELLPLRTKSGYVRFAWKAEVAARLASLSA
jgi:hypothetical protein